LHEILTTVDEGLEKTDQINRKTKEEKKGLMQTSSPCIGHKKFKKTEMWRNSGRVGVRRFKELLGQGILIDIQDGNHGSDHPKSSDYVSFRCPFYNGK